MFNCHNKENKEREYAKSETSNNKVYVFKRQNFYCVNASVRCIFGICIKLFDVFLPVLDVLMA